MDKLSPLASLHATRATLKAYGLATKYTYGQNFLINDGILQRIMKLADVTIADVILEVGPGIGTLTIPLLKTASRVISVERDTDLLPVLQETCAPWWNKLTLISADALRLQSVDLQAAPQTVEDVADAATLTCTGITSPGYHQPTDRTSINSFAAASQQDEAHTEAQNLKHAGDLPNKLVSNLPYEIAAPVVLDYFQRFNFLQSATVMVQKEVADRMMAQPGSKDYGAYTVKLSLYAQPVDRFAVAPSNFFPSPRVDSAVIRLNRVTLTDDAEQPLDQQLLDLTCLMADAAFANRRKTLANSFKAFFMAKTSASKAGAMLHKSGVPDEGRKSDNRTEVWDRTRISPFIDDLPQLFAAASIDPRRRGETLSRAEFIALAQAALGIFPY